MSTIDSTTSDSITQKLATKLAGLTQICPTCDGNNLDAIAFMPCPDCHGAGRIYIFPDEVRLLCTYSVDSTYLNTDNKSNCAVCKNLGWVASKDLAVWINSIETVWPHGHIEYRHNLISFLPSCITASIPAKQYVAAGEMLPAILVAIAQVVIDMYIDTDPNNNLNSFVAQ